MIMVNFVFSRVCDREAHWLLYIGAINPDATVLCDNLSDTTRFVREYNTGIHWWLGTVLYSLCCVVQCPVYSVMFCVVLCLVCCVVYYICTVGILHIVLDWTGISEVRISCITSYTNGMTLCNYKCIKLKLHHEWLTLHSHLCSSVVVSKHKHT